MKSRGKAGQSQWESKSTVYTHPIDTQLFADIPLYMFLEDINGKWLLDIGCGNGYILRQLQEKGAAVTGIDVSSQMIHQIISPIRQKTKMLCVASADHLPVVSGLYDMAVCVLTINNFSSIDMTRRSFLEVSRVLKTSGVYVISLPHPHTLDAKTHFRWTEWAERQTQASLQPGEEFKRWIRGSNDSMLSIINYYWPKYLLIEFAKEAGFQLDGVAERTASPEELEKYTELEPIHAKIPFFLVMRFVKLPT